MKWQEGPEKECIDRLMTSDKSQFKRCDKRLRTIMTGFLQIAQARRHASLNGELLNELDNDLPWVLNGEREKNRWSMPVDQLRTVDEGKSKKKKVVRNARMIHRTAISNPGELYIVTFRPRKVKSNCFKRMVKQGPSRRPICRQPTRVNHAERSSFPCFALLTKDFRQELCTCFRCWSSRDFGQ